MTRGDVEIHTLPDGIFRIRMTCPEDAARLFRRCVECVSRNEPVSFSTDTDSWYVWDWDDRGAWFSLSSRMEDVSVVILGEDGVVEISSHLGYGGDEELDRLDYTKPPSLDLDARLCILGVVKGLGLSA